MSNKDTFIDHLEDIYQERPSLKAKNYIDKFWDRTRRGQTISGKVEGNHWTYTVSIQLLSSERFISRCSCYIGKHGRCHHCEALAHTYLKYSHSFTVIEPVPVVEYNKIKSLDTLHNYLQGVTLDELIQELKKKGITQKAFAESIGMTTQKIGAIKRSEARNRHVHELGAVKLACLWVLQNLT